MSSWLGACMIAGCAIGATGIVIHHYSSSAYQVPPKITYMINEQEWVDGVVTEFNNKVEELIPVDTRLFAITEINKYGTEVTIDNVNYKDHPHKHRSKCVSMMADAYRKEKDDDFKSEYKKIFEIIKCPRVLKEASSISV